MGKSTIVQKKKFKLMPSFFEKHIKRRKIDSPAHVGETTRKEGCMPPNEKGILSVEEFYVTFQRDVNTFKEKLPQLFQEFPGEYVAILDGEIVAHMPQWKNLVDLTRKKYPKKFVFVEKISLEKNAIESMDSLEG